jgi:hypothetical protein
MAYTKQRFLTANLLTTAMLTPSSQAAGTVASAKKTGTGTATLTSSGLFTGAVDLLVTVQCDAAGTVGSGATFRWRTSATVAGTWDASGVSATTALTALGSAGLQITLSAGTLVLLDKWQFWAYAAYGPGNLLSNDRDQYFQSGAFSEMILNGGFTSAATSWGAQNATLASVAGGLSGNCLEITRTGSTSQTAYQSMATVAGQLYKVSAWAKSGTSGDEQARVVMYDVTGAAQIAFAFVTTAATGWQEITFNFTAPSASSRIYLYKNTATAGTMLFDTVSLLAVPQFVIDVGSAQAVTALVIADHNLSTAAVVKLEGNSSNAWTTPAYSLTLTNASPYVSYLTQTYRYWRLTFNDLTNADGWVSLGKLYLGTYREVASGELWGATTWGSERIRERTRVRTVSEAGRSRRRVYSANESFALQYTTLSDTELATLQAVFDATYNLTTGQDLSIFVHYWNDEEETCFLCECLSDDFKTRYQRGRKEVTLSWREEVITRIV